MNMHKKYYEKTNMYIWHTAQRQNIKIRIRLLNLSLKYQSMVIMDIHFLIIKLQYSYYCFLVNSMFKYSIQYKYYKCDYVCFHIFILKAFNP